MSPSRTVTALAACCAALVGSAPARAQAPRIVAALEPDTVQVGEAFTVGVTVTQSAAGAVEFPAALPLEEDLEQRGPVRIRESDGGLVWRAYYTLVAWRADTLAVPAVELTTAATGSAVLSVRPPAIVVRSILPADAAEFELREAKPFLRVRGFPWWVLLLFAGIAALVWWWWRARAVPVPVAAARGPAADALREFDRLRGDWLGGGLSGDGFYDRFEAALRRYAKATRGWSPARGMLALGDADSPLWDALRRSLIVRFARVRPADEGPLEALDAGERFVRSELGGEEASEQGEEASEEGDGTSQASSAADRPAEEVQA